MLRALLPDTLDLPNFNLNYKKTRFSQKLDFSRFTNKCLETGHLLVNLGFEISDFKIFDFRVFSLDNIFEQYVGEISGNK